jgi:DNA-binding response OmpR family regulator
VVKLLIIDSDVSYANTLHEWFSAQNFFVEKVTDGTTALDCLKTNRFDVILLGGQLSGMTAQEVCTHYRQNGGQTPIIMASDVAPSATGLVEQALDAGVDDFVTRSCALSELSARIRALLRRPPSTLANSLSAGDISLDTVTNTVTKAGVEISLHPMEIKLLEFLLRHPNQVFSPLALYERVWQEQIGTRSTADTVRTHIKTLRRKIGLFQSRPLIQSVLRRGYKLVP